MYMRSRRERLADSRLYVLIDAKVCADRGIDIFGLAEKLRDAGAGLVQLRDKISSRCRIKEEAAGLAAVFAGSETLFILNDHPDIALDCGCDGVHLGQSDMAADEARRLLGREKLIGISCSSLEQALAAQSAGADYLGIGPVFPTATKECSAYAGMALVGDLVPKGTLVPQGTLAPKGAEASTVNVPFFCIGGICAANLPELLRAGAGRVAVCSAVITAADPAAEVERFTTLLRRR